MALNKLSNGTIAVLSPVSFWVPEYVSQSAWIEHGPFAFWISEALKPRCLVELGSHWGYSYFAFCQAIDRLRLGTSAYAVDTWQGDEHAGFYDQRVFQAVSTHNKNKYTAFSRLIRSTFEDALQYFPDKSVDLLHIDGRHFYDDVKYDYEIWRPKLSDNAIVLFHDTNVRERGFGVWQFFKELSVDHPSFEFLHGNGLGVLAIGEVPAALAPLFGASDEDADQIRAVYAALGGSITPRRALQAKSEGIAAVLKPGADITSAHAETYAKISDWDEQVQEVRRALEAQAALIKDLQAIVVQRDKQVNELAHHASELETIRRHAIELETTVRTQTEALAALRQELDRQEHLAAAYRHEADTVAQSLNAIQNSTSWRLTLPLRKALEGSPTLRQLPRHAAKVASWTITGQLGQKLRARRAPSQSVSVPLQSTTSATAQFPEAPPEPIRESARSVEEDYGLAIPLNFSLQRQVPRFAVILHLFHERLAGEFRSYLENVPGEFDIFISTTHERGQSAIQKTFGSWSRGRIDVRILPNRGRDIAPKLVGFRDVYDQYEFVLHLHSKKSPHASMLFFWRQFLLENLVGTPEVVRSVFEVFERNPQIGMIAPQHFEPVRPWINWGGNFPAANRLAERMGVALDETKVLDFPSGSMFWARSAALKPLLDLNLTFEDFPEEAGQTDATLAHAIERLYFYVCEHAGYDWVKVARPELFEFTPAIFTARSPSDLDHFLEEFRLRLLAPSGPIPRETFPTPIEHPTRQLLESVQKRSLGLDTAIDPDLKVVIGIVTHNNTPEVLQEAVASAHLSLKHAGLLTAGRIHLLDNGESSAEALAEGGPVVRRASVGNVGFGAGHNLLMRSAFDEGADLYIAINPDGALHPESVEALIQVMNANYGRALVEALQFPLEHQKPYDPYTLDTPWVSGVCLAVSRQVFEELGGFDETFFMYCEDVDLSWRAWASGIPLKICPRALFKHAVTNREASPETLRMMFQSGVILARKWGSEDFEAWLKTELEARGFALPEANPKPVPVEWRRHADFTHHFSFAEPRW